MTNDRSVLRIALRDDAAEFIEIDVAARDDARDAARAGTAGESTCGSRGTGTFGNDTRAFGEQAYGGGDLVETCFEGTVEQLYCKLGICGKTVRAPMPSTNDGVYSAV